MTPDEAVEYVSRITYKKNTRFRTTPGDDGSVAITLACDFPDTLNPPAWVTVDKTYRIGPLVLGMMSPTTLLSDIRTYLVWPMEMHEADEHLRIDGIAPYHPHPEEQF